VQKTVTYASAGVDIDEGDRMVSLIRPIVGTTHRREVLGGIGGFAGFFRFPAGKYRDPVLVSGTDGVGTKVKVAAMAKRLGTVGIDLVAMCVNDILVHGAEPLFFLDYYATGKLSARDGAEIVSGIAEGCRQAGCALLGGETAEMPSVYAPGEFDLAGFAVGAVDRKRIIDGSAVRPGDVLVGLSSSGLHSNGYSLARKIVFERMKKRITSRIPEWSCSARRGSTFAPSSPSPGRSGSGGWPTSRGEGSPGTSRGYCRADWWRSSKRGAGSCRRSLPPSSKRRGFPKRRRTGHSTWGSAWC